MKDEQILVVDRATATRHRLKLALRTDERRVILASTVMEGLALCHRSKPVLAFVGTNDRDHPGFRGFEIVRDRLGCPVVAMSDTPSPSEAVVAIRRGASDYLDTGSEPMEFEASAQRLLQAQRQRREVGKARSEVQDQYGFNQLLTQSPAMLEVFDKIRQVAQTDATVLVLGETGTGKELVSRAVHERSSRQDKPFVAVNCGAFTETLLESELFGHEKGSFTGAIGRQEGLFEMADGGSLFLDELGETSASVQVNLLRVLETMSFRRVGGRDDVHVDVRIIAATHVHLDKAVDAGDFRRDLFYRLNVFPLILPPLNERPEDIPLLMRHFLDDIGQRYQLEPPSLSPGAMASILKYAWPGNVRQLRAMCERWVITHSGRRLSREHLPATFEAMPKVAAQASGVNPLVPLKDNLDVATARIEKEYLQRVLERCEGHLGQTAEAAGITRRTLYTKIRHYELDVDKYRS